MIIYRKTQTLRLRRSAYPQPPYWCATTVAPYSSKRGAPIAIDYLDLRASRVDSADVTVTENVRDELERTRSLRDPLLIDATELAERIFRRGEEALEFCAEHRMSAVHLVSTRSALPLQVGDAVVVLCAWPLDFPQLEELCAGAREQRLRWGMAVPILFPVTTDLTALAQLAELARTHGAAFFASIALDADPTAKQAIAQSLTLEDDHETYDTLFHADLEPLHVATERHIAALAHANEMADFIVPPTWGQPTNWNAATLLTLTAARMIAMAHEPELAGTLNRSARIVAELEKPIARIAEAASLSIVEALDEVTVDLLTEWLERGRSAFVDRVNEAWRMRRDYLGTLNDEG